MTDEDQTPQAEQPPEMQDAPPVSPAAPISADADERERRKQAAAQLMAEPGAQLAAGAQPEVPTEPFTRGAWAGFERYQCRYCPWDTLHEALAWDHYGQRHGPGAQGDEEE